MLPLELMRSRASREKGWTGLLKAAPCKNREDVDKYDVPFPVKGLIGTGREKAAAFTGNRLCRSSLCRPDCFGLEAGLLLRVVRDAPEAGLRSSVSRRYSAKTVQPAASQH